MSRATMWAGRMAIIVAMALIAWWLSPLPFWACLILGTVGWAANGAVIEVEDNQSGGWSNQDGMQPPFTIQSRQEVIIAGAQRVFIAFAVLLGLGILYGVIERLWHAS